MKYPVIFKDRIDAGQRLASELWRKYSGKRDMVVYGLPRGGVVLAHEVSHCLNVPLDVVVVRKIPHPQVTEHAIGAITETGDTVYDTYAIRHISKEYIIHAEEKELLEAKHKRTLYNLYSKPISPRGKIAILVDDGVATGLTLDAGIKELIKRKPAKIIVAVPVMPYSLVDLIEQKVDDCVVLSTPVFFKESIANYYENFSEVTDQEVIKLLDCCSNIKHVNKNTKRQKVLKQTQTKAL